MRIGFGYDVHGFAAERALILGGARVDYHLGLMGHSDADVLVHAVIDALLGATGLGDIGRHFPPTDMRYKDISSMKLLEETARLVRDAGFSVVNIDSTIVAERPRLAGLVQLMAENIAKALAINPSAVNVKATTTEGLGFAGRGEGIAAYAAALIEEKGV